MRQVWVLIACGCAALVALCGCENKLSALKRAARLARLQRHAEAIGAYERYLELVGTGPGTEYERAEAWYQIGLIRTYQLKDRANGIAAFEQAVALRGDYPDPQFHLGYQYIDSARGQSPEQVAELRGKAAGALTAGLAECPEVVDFELALDLAYSPRVSLSYVERDRGHLNEAIRQLYIFERYSEDDARDWAEIGSFFLSHGEHAKALFYFQRAFNALDENQRGQPVGMVVRNALIDTGIRNGYLERAKELLDESQSVLNQYRAQYESLPPKAREGESSLGTTIRTWRLELLSLLERIDESSGKYGEALGVVREYHSLVPEAKALLLKEAQLLARMGDCQAARVQLEQYHDLAPRDPEWMLTEADILYQEKAYKAYINKIEEYLAIKPEKTQPRGLRALALVKAGQVDEGIVQIESYLRAVPNSPPFQLKMAQALSVAGETREAIWWLRRLMDTDIVAPHNLLSDPDLEKVRQDPEFPDLLREARYRISLLQDVHEAEDRLYQGYTSQGIGALQRLRKENPEIPFTTYVLARAYVLVGDHDAAFELLLQCAKAGFFSPTRLRDDIYLTELRSDEARWNELLDSVEQPWPSAAPPTTPIE